MLNETQWRPTKFVRRRGRWGASRDPEMVARGSRLITERTAVAYSRAMDAHARGALLDLGCGSVPLYACYRPHVDTITCLDWPDSFHATTHVDVHADLSEPLPLGDDSFDTIVATDVLEHLPYPDRLWGELRRVVRSGGKVVVGVPFLYWLHEQPHDHFRYTEHRLRRFCSDHGFTVVECAPYGGGPDIAVDVLSKLLARFAVARPMLSALTWLSLRLNRPNPSSALPLGYLLVAEAI